MRNKINFTQLQCCYLVFHTSERAKSTTTTKTLTFIFEFWFDFVLFHFIFQVIGIICMSLASPAFLTSTHWFLFVVVTAFIATLLWVAVYFLGIREVLNLSVNWILTVSVLKSTKMKCLFFSRVYTIIFIHISKNNSNSF